MRSAIRGARGALVGMTLLLACRSSSDPGAVADRFVDLYFVEADQEAALPMTAGPARAALARELEAVRDLRRTGYTAGQARGEVYYERTTSQVDRAAGRALFVYDLTLGSGEHKSYRHSVLILGPGPETGPPRPESWQIVSFQLVDGPSRAAGDKRQ